MNSLVSYFPHRRDFADGRVAYIVELYGQRGRINITTKNNLLGIDIAY